MDERGAGLTLGRLFKRLEFIKVTHGHERM